jgi:hypothetical protein
MPALRAAAPASAASATEASRRIVSTAASPRTASSARRRNPGTSSRSSWMRLVASSVDCSVMPVTLPPGRPRLVATPCPTGSAIAAITIGIVLVARATTRTAGPEVTITSGRVATSSSTVAKNQLRSLSL